MWAMLIVQFMSPGCWTPSFLTLTTGLGIELYYEVVERCYTILLSLLIQITKYTNYTGNTEDTRRK